jgi:hypothetical protein
VLPKWLSVLMHAKRLSYGYEYRLELFMANSALSPSSLAAQVRLPTSGKILIVPIISSFFGIVIRMFFDDHAPPHFHAEYQGQEALVTFDGRISEGEISSARARKLIKEWAALHRMELELNWRRAKKLKPLENIAPLD